MEKEDARKQSREVLQERRKQVIRLHRKGVGVMQIVEQGGAFNPCAYRADAFSFAQHCTVVDISSSVAG